MHRKCIPLTRADFALKLSPPEIDFLLAAVMLAAAGVLFAQKW